MLTKEEFSELFEVQVRGTIASAFVHGGVSPSDEHWKMMRGEIEPTMRAIGEIGHLTGYNMYVQLSEPRRAKDAPRGHD